LEDVFPGGMKMAEVEEVENMTEVEGMKIDVKKESSASSHRR
jgi:hypothetical protein